MTKLFVGGIPLEITELEFVQHLSPYSEVATIKIVRYKKSRLCKGYAFIEVLNFADAEQIMDALDGTMIDGRGLTINIVKEPAPVKMIFQKPGQGTYSSRLNATKTKRPRITKS